MQTLPPISPATLAAAERFRAPLEAYGRACGDLRRACNAYCQNPTDATRAAMDAAADLVSITRAEMDEAKQVTR